MNQFGMRPGIILLREGTDTSQGKPQLISNINACSAIADSIRTTLGPSGRDKLIGTSNGQVTISNDGATIMKLLEIEHPAAKTLVDISMSQDIEVGDGTTSVVLLAAEILSCLKSFVDENVHPQIIMQCIKKASEMAVDQISKLSINFEDDSDDSNSDSSQYKEMLLKCASTALNSKLISTHKDLFAPMVVDAVLELSKQNGLDDIKEAIAIKKIPGGDVRQSFRVPSGGVAFKKTFSYAGFEQMSKHFSNPNILLLNVELELKSEKENAEVRIEATAEASINETYQSIVDAEWDIIYSKLNNCIQIGSNIVLSRLPIGDLATQYFADHGLFCAGRVTDDDIYRISKATGAVIQTTTNNMTDTKVLGTCGKFEEKQVGDERFNIFTECPNTLTSTIILRGGTEQFIAESERSIHDAIMVVKRCIQSTHHGIVPGGGAIEMELSKFLRQYSLTIKGKQQLIVNAYAKALEVIPRQLSDNAGYDATDILSALRKKHQTTPSETDSEEEHGKYFGVDVDNGSICNTYTKGVWEPCDNKMNSIQAATEAACVILSIDETVIAPRSQDPAAQQASGQMGGGGGAPMSSMMGNAMQTAQYAQGGTKGNLGPGVSYMKGRN